jgi:hypothetical protein
VYKQVMMEVRRTFNRCKTLPGELFQAELRVDDDCGLLAFTSDDADRLTGYHHPRLLICITEAQGCNESVFEAAAACATGENNRIFAYGNPLRPSGTFYQYSRSDLWAKLRISAFDHPNVKEGREVIPGGISQRWIDDQRAQWGETSPFYLARVLAQFPESSIEGLIQRAWLNAAAERHASGALEAEARKHSPLLAVDVARYGDDSTVVTEVQGPIVRRLHVWRHLSTTEIRDRVIELRAAIWARGGFERQPNVVVDEPGLGGGLIDVLREKKVRVITFNGANEPNDKKRFFNRRAESMWHARELLENGRVAMPSNETLAEEALAHEWQIRPTDGSIQIVSKDEIKKSLGRSPDLWDSVTMGLWHSVGNAMPVGRRFVHEV